MLIKYILLVLLIHLVISSVTFAECSREDIQFYLDKGFSQDQITQLCSVSGGSNDSSTPDYTPYQQKVIIYKEGGGEEKGIKDGLTKEEREARGILKAGGSISNLVVTPETVSYTAKTCIVSASTPDVNQRYKDCVDVDFVVQRKDLVVSSSGKKLLFFGSQYALLEGKIKATPKRAWDSYPIDIRKALQRNFEWKENGEKTTFPIAGDYSVTRIVNAFRTLAATYRQADEKTQVAASEQESKSEKVSDKKKEKKKRWWNPFD